MTARLGHLESRVDRVEKKLDTIIERLGVIATKSDMRNYVLTAIGLFLAIVAILVTAMGWLETRIARVQTAPASPPTVLYLPAPSAPTPAPPSHSTPNSR
jgi:hypothetical protein